MIITSTENIQGYEVKTLSVVFGNTVEPSMLGKT